MAVEAKPHHQQPAGEERPFAELRATPAELAQLRAEAPPPRTVEEWLQGAIAPTEEELADLDWFLREREAMRQRELERLEERVAELEE